jgi:hypothetical protein
MKVDELSEALETVLGLLKADEPIAIELEQADRELVELARLIASSDNLGSLIAVRPGRPLDEMDLIELAAADEQLLALAEAVGSVPRPSIDCAPRRTARRCKR